MSTILIISIVFMLLGFEWENNSGLFLRVDVLSQILVIDTNLALINEITIIFSQACSLLY